MRTGLRCWFGPLARARGRPAFGVPGPSDRRPTYRRNEKGTTTFNIDMRPLRPYAVRHATRSASYCRLHLVPRHELGQWPPRGLPQGRRLSGLPEETVARHLAAPIGWKRRRSVWDYRLLCGPAARLDSRINKRACPLLFSLVVMVHSPYDLRLGRLGDRWIRRVIA